MPVERVALGPDRLAGLPAAGGSGVLVPDDAQLAVLVPGATAGLVVVDREDPGGGTALVTRVPVDRTHLVAAEAVVTATDGLRSALAALRAEAAVIDALQSVGRRLTAQLDIDQLVQEATDAATTAVGAAFGAFFYNLINQFGESYTLYTLSGVPREAFSRFPMPRNTLVFAPTFDGEGTVRSDDITADRRFGHNTPYHGMPEGHLPVSSYLAVSVISPTSGEVLGGFFFGHPERARFTSRHEYLAEGIAGYSAIALDNAQLYERERNFTRELSRSMLPEAPAVPGLDLVTRYLPAATGHKIGGDWFDVIPLDGGGTAVVIGDVVGHGVTAATIMGQVRTAIRAYAVLGLAPSDVLRHVSALLETFAEPTFVTCFYAVLRPDEGLVYANAGHLPARAAPRRRHDRAARGGHGPAARRRPRLLRAQRGVPARDRPPPLHRRAGREPHPRPDPGHRVAARGGRRAAPAGHRRGLRRARREPHRRRPRRRRRARPRPPRRARWVTALTRQALECAVAARRLVRGQ